MDKYWWKHVELFIFKRLYPTKALHKERIPEGGAVLVFNHLRAIDGAAMHEAYLTDVGIVAKKELVKKKIAARFLSHYGVIPIDRQNPSIKDLLSCVRVLKEGHKLLIFPEGTRNKEGTKIREIKSGAGAIAVMGKAPVVPVIFFEHERLFRKTYMLVGEPVDLSAYYGKKMTEDVQSEIDAIIYSSMLETQKKLDEYMLTNKHKKRFDDKKRAVKVKKSKCK